MVMLQLLTCKLAYFQIKLNRSNTKSAYRWTSAYCLGPKPEDSKRREVTSLWELTLSERTNAARFVTLTTARPFVYCRYYFKCFFCHEHHSDIQKLLEHTSTHDIPDQANILKELLKKGRRTLKVDISQLRCRMCLKDFSDLDAMRQHLTADHGILFTQSGNGVVAYNLATQNELLCCHICSKKFQTFILLNRHMNVHFSNSVCEVCGAGFMTHQRLMQHKEIHQPGGHPCGKCNKIYTTNSNLKFHIEKAHEGNRKTRMLRCPHCSERFTEHFRKLKHLKELHGVTFTYECEVCKLTFPSRRALTTHTNRQHSSKTQCAVCKKCFSCITALKVHMRCHSSERDFLCEICQKSYRHKKSLKYHMRSHLNGDQNIKFTCPECSIGFPGRVEFSKHVREWHPSSYFDFVVH